VLPAPIPGRAASRRRRRTRRLALAVALLCVARPAAAIEVSLSAPRERNGTVWTDVRLDDLFSPRVEESLARGLPATLELHAELWRRRDGWFDQLRASFDASVGLRWEPWLESYRVDGLGPTAIAVANLDSVEAVLDRSLALPVARVASLDPSARYYVVVSATLRPLSAKDIEESEEWLSGENEARERRRPGLDLITALPRALFDTVRNFAGFGDQRARAFTPDFSVRSLLR
jgi:hypothetical protein